MIGYLEGTVKMCETGKIIILCGGIGYEIWWTGHKVNEGEKIKAWIHEHRGERDVRLFGFDNVEGKNIFRKLISVKGVGPSIAYNILRVLKPEQVLHAISDENPEMLSNADGVGRKIAVRIINELKGTFEISPESEVSAKESGIESALIDLGYNPSEVRRILSEIKQSGQSLENYGEIIKKAIKRLKS